MANPSEFILSVTGVLIVVSFEDISNKLARLRSVAISAYLCAKSSIRCWNALAAKFECIYLILPIQLLRLRQYYSKFNLIIRLRHESPAPLESC